MVLPRTRIASYPSRLFNAVCDYYGLNPDLSKDVVLQGTHYIAIGEVADLWLGSQLDEKVAVKVLRGGSPSEPSYLQEFRAATQQVDARGSTFTNVQGDQRNNIQITFNNNYASNNNITELPDDGDPNIDPELNKYPPLRQYGFDVVASTTKLITTSIAAAATHLALPVLSDSVTNTLESITVTKTVYRYSFFAKSDNICTAICTSCLKMMHL
ncbi:hypothetical protein PILCRDRAFT_822324 [Piloderma croceum F 1598]|uniref:Uncharacterized protein n=1 Tax=Piloderma croceum (strain F 1598) TaxID=765440 RepID=A0A0C3FM58_PILCF|nr:hypothetical protein PILCRDRAFT_822324 [Piloderma croceum F 1598]